MSGLAPTLGIALLDWMHQDAELVHGAGSVQGQRIDFDGDRRAAVARMFEVHPWPRCPGCGLDHDVAVWDYPWDCPGCGDRLPAIRAWDHYKLSRPKGWGKTSLASKLVVADAVGPVVFDGWDSSGEPVGRPRRRPIVNCFATEEGQAGQTYTAACVILGHLEESGWAAANGYRLDIGREAGTSSRTFVHTRFGTFGEVRPRTASQSAAEGGQPTMSVVDESHLWTSRVLRQLYEVEVLNLGKGDSGGWVLETTTMYRPGEGSVAERSEQAATDNRTGVHVDHRAAPDDLEVWEDRQDHRPDVDALTEATEHAYGDAYRFAVSMPKRVRLFSRTDLLQSELERKYLNRKVESDDRFIYGPRWELLTDDSVDPDWWPESGEHVVLGFDGSLVDDHTGLVGVHVPTARLFVAGHWDPADHDGHVPEQKVDDAVNAAFRRWQVTRMYPDPPDWRSWVASWQRRHGDAVKEFYTQSKSRMSPALKAFREAATTGALSHTGHEALAEHLTNAVLVRSKKSGRDPDDDGEDAWWWKLAKPKQTRGGDKIDLGVAAVPAWAAYLDAIAEGDEPKRQRSGPVFATFK